MHPPEFWSTRRGTAPALLSPLSALYASLGRLRARMVTPWQAPVPVVCVGNLTVGGAGKTPTALAIGEHLRARGRRVGFLTRGYGGRAAGPLAVDPKRHTAQDVGDEALLLAELAPSWVARDRRAGARAAIAAGIDVIIMDDGFQNPSLLKQVAIVVVDGGYGFGNGRVLPAGPLREPIAEGLARADAIVIVGEDRCGAAQHLPRDIPLLRARLMPDVAAERLAGLKVVAFAGIGRPEKFFATLTELGVEIVERHGFPDHHRYTADEVMRIVEGAAARKAIPVTTAKDFVRLSTEARPMVTPVRVRLVIDDLALLERVLALVTAPAIHRPANA